MRLENGKMKTFTGGIAWIDRQGFSRISTNPRSGEPVSVADRSYFKAVVSTGGPFVSEGLVTRNANRRVVIMAVPTRNLTGRLTGVLVGALGLRASPTDQRTIDGLRRPHHPRPRSSPGDARKLRAAQERRHPSPHQHRQGRAHRCQRPRWLEWACRRLCQLQGTGLDVGDRPSRCDRVPPARNRLPLELVVIAGAALAVLCIIGWASAAVTTGAGGRVAPGAAVGRVGSVARRRIRHGRGFASARSCTVRRVPGGAGDRRRARGRRSNRTVSTFGPPGRAAGGDDPSAEAIAFLPSRRPITSLFGHRARAVLGQSIAEPSRRRCARSTGCR